MAASSADCFHGALASLGSHDVRVQLCRDIGGKPAYLGLFFDCGPTLVDMRHLDGDVASKMATVDRFEPFVAPKDVRRGYVAFGGIDDPDLATWDGFLRKLIGGWWAGETQSRLDTKKHAATIARFFPGLVLEKCDDDDDDADLIQPRYVAPKPAPPTRVATHKTPGAARPTLAVKRERKTAAKDRTKSRADARRVKGVRDTI